MLHYLCNWHIQKRFNMQWYQYIITQIMSTSKTQFLAPFLKIYKGMKIIIMENLYPKLGIVNGSIGNIKNTSFTYGYKKLFQCIPPPPPKMF